MHVLAMLFVLAVASFALAVIVGTLSAERARILQALSGQGVSSRQSVNFVKFETHSTPRPRVIARVAACPARSDNVVSLPVRPRALAA